MDQAAQRVEVDGGVAVGVDGSPASLNALLAAAEEVRRRDAVLHVVRAWSMRTVRRPAECPQGAVPSMEQYQESVTRDTESLIEHHLGADHGLTIKLHVVHASPPQAMLAAAEGADLLVVGHRGRGGFAGLLLGSVAEQVVRHASSPVLVVRPNV